MFRLSTKHQVSVKQYQEWLTGLTEDDVVAVQQFERPAGPLNKGPAVERWAYTKATLRHQIDGWDAEWPGGAGRFRSNGQGLKFGANSAENNPVDEWGEVFPARLVPIDDYYLGQAFELERCFAAFDKPIYEPLFTGQQRHHYFLPLVEQHPAARNRAKIASSVRHYTHEVIDGRKLTAFAPEPLKQSDQLGVGWRYLYSEQI